MAFPALQGEHTADVCIIGGGYTGLSSAIHLRERGYSVILLEANRLAWGASGRNGGHIGVGQRVDQDRLETMVGMAHAKQLWEIGLEANDTVASLIERFSIDCELKQGNLHVASRAGVPSLFGIACDAEQRGRICSELYADGNRRCR